MGALRAVADALAPCRGSAALLIDKGKVKGYRSMIYDNLQDNLPLAFGVVMGTLFALVGVLLCTVGVATLRKWFASRHWPQVPAHIVACEIKEVRCFEDQVMFQPEVKFTFAAGSGEFTGSNLAFADKLYPTREQAAKAVSRYPVGMVAMARYDPEEPAQAVLVRRGAVAGLLLAGMGFAMVIGPLWGARQAGLPAGWFAAILAGLAGAGYVAASSAGHTLSRARRAGIYPSPGRGSDEDVERLARQGEKMLAIRLYRELHGTDLKTSRLQVEKMRAGKTPGGGGR